MPLQIIVTAGGQAPSELRASGHPDSKALLRVGEQTLLSRVVDAAMDLPERGDIIIVGAEELKAELPGSVQHVVGTGSVIDNLLLGFRHHGGVGHDYLVLSADLPFVTTDALHVFVEMSAKAAEMTVPVVTRSAFEIMFPNPPNKFERVDGKDVTMGSAFYMSGALLQANVPLMQDFARFRKQPWKLAVLLGFEVAFQYLIKRVRLDALERRASQLTGGAVRGIQLEMPGLAFDIDSAAEYGYAVSHARRLNEVTASPNLLETAVP